MDLVQIDEVDLQLAQAVVHGVDDALPGVIAADLGGEKAAFPVAVLQGLADGGLARAVGLCRVEKGDAAVDGGANSGDGEVILDVTHTAADRPGSEADDGNLRSVVAQLPIFHFRFAC